MIWTWGRMQKWSTALFLETAAPCLTSTLMNKLRRA
ncbi:hypothetical protein MHYP_G00232080 [Metynnis hypsauchen]